MQRKDWLPSFLTFYLTFPTLNIISKYFSNIVILIRFADVELPCRYAVIKSLLLLLLLLLLYFIILLVFYISRCICNVGYSAFAPLPYAYLFAMEIMC